MAKGWMIFVDGLDNPQKVHRTQNSAWREMHRLAMLNPGKDVLLLQLNRRFRFVEGTEGAESVGSHLPSNALGMVDKSDLIRRQDLKAAQKKDQDEIY